MKRIALLTGLLFILLAGSASAAEWLPDGSGFAGQTPATDPIVLGSVQAADAYWTRKGYQPGPASVFLYDTTAALAQGELNGTRLWVNRVYAASVYEQTTRVDRRMEVRAICMTITHERGHNLGLQHTETGVMAHDLGGAMTRECRSFALRVVPKKARKR